MTNKTQKLYTQSGVNLDNAKDLINRIGSCSNNIGRFGAVCEYPFLKDYYLVTTTDGIGSKLLPLYEKERYSTIAQDLAAMNLNDLACSGAKPLSFTDYIAANTLKPEALAQIIIELKKCLEKYGCELAGGETSETPSIIREGKIDISGFALGVVKKENLLDKSKVKCGDIIVGLSSSGIHSNGFSLIDFLYKKGELTDSEFEACLAPTKIYVNEIAQLATNKLLKSAANITGGGIEANLSRALPPGIKAEIDYSLIPSQPIFEKLFELCKQEAYEVFNMGAGFCVVTSEQNCAQVMKMLEKYNPFVFAKAVKA